jgi:hypothetical protein
LSSFSSFLVIVANDPFGCHDIDLGGLGLASLVLTSLIVACNPFGHGLHVDHCFPFPPFWLELLMNFMVVMILILVV